jgi:hypothetical protein
MIDAVVPGTAVNVSATASSVGGTIDCTGCDTVRVANTSATLHVGVRIGTGAQTAVLTTDVVLPPLGVAYLPANPLVDRVAAIGSGAGPTTVNFAPIRRGQTG